MSLDLYRATLLKCRKSLFLDLALALKWVGPATTLHQPRLLNYRGLWRLLTLNLTETHANVCEDISIPALVLFINFTTRLLYSNGGVDNAGEL